MMEEPIVLKLSKADLSAYLIKHQIRSKTNNKNRPIKIYIDDFSEQTIKELASIKKELENEGIILQDVYYLYGKEYIYDDKEIAKLKKSALLCEELGLNMGIKLGNDPNLEAGFKDFLISKKIIENFAKEVNNFEMLSYGERIPLSPLEKFAIVYRFATKHYYKADSNFHNNDMRSWLGALSSGYIICSGFASLLKVLCDLVFKKEELQCFYQSSEDYDKAGNSLGRHANNYLYINDEKYGYTGFYFNDSCLDCMDTLEDGKFDHFMLPLYKMKYQKNETNYFDGNDIIHIITNLKHRPENMIFSDNNSQLLKFFGYKTLEDIKREYGDYKEMVDKENAAIEKDRQKYALEKFEEILNANQNNKNFIDFFLLPTPKKSTLLKNYPILKRLKDYLNQVDINNIAIDENLLKEYKKFTQEHKELMSDNKIIDDLVYIHSIKKFPELDIHKEYEYHKKQILKKYNEQVDKFAKDNESLFFPQELNQFDLEQCLRAVGQFEKMKGQKLEKFIKNQTKSRKDFLASQFVKTDKKQEQADLTFDWENENI